MPSTIVEPPASRPKVGGARPRRPSAALAGRARVVCIGGGTGLPVALRGLSRWAEPADGRPGLDLTAVVAMTDDGGSSGRLRRARGLLPPGDVRNCLVALASRPSPLREVFRYRFGGAGGLRGHTVGNLVIAALAEKRGDFLEAVRESAQLLSITGTVLPSTLLPVQLVATMADGRVVIGERHLGHGKPGRVKQVALLPEHPPPADGLLAAITAADLVVIGPGSLYSSMLPNLLVEGVAEALRDTRALRVLVANLMTEPGETDEMSCEEHLDVIREHAGPVVDAVLYNDERPAPEVLARYERRGSAAVSADRESLLERGVIPMRASLLHAGERVRHDSRKLGRCLLELAYAGVKSA